MNDALRQPLAEVDPITFEVIKHRLWQINDEQSIAIRTISSSPIVVEGNDFNVGLFTDDGQLTTAGIGSLVHVGTMGDALRTIMKGAVNTGQGVEVRPADIDPSEIWRRRRTVHGYVGLIGVDHKRTRNYRQPKIRAIIRGLRNPDKVSSGAGRHHSREVERSVGIACYRRVTIAPSARRRRQLSSVCPRTAGVKRPCIAASATWVAVESCIVIEPGHENILVPAGNGDRNLVLRDVGIGVHRRIVRAAVSPRCLGRWRPDRSSTLFRRRFHRLATDPGSVSG